MRDQFLVTPTSDLLYGTVAQWSADASTLYFLGSNLYAAPVTASGLGTDTVLLAWRPLQFRGRWRLDPLSLSLDPHRNRTAAFVRRIA